MNEIIAMVLTTIGALFVLSTSLAMVRKRDVYLRINVTTKTATLGLGLILGAAMVYFNEYSVTTRVLATIIFVGLTAPIGGHMLARAAYINKTEKWEGMKIDDLAGQYDPKKDILHSKKKNTKFEPPTDYDKPSTK
ncbi:MAG: monovalent cation/H(+) antiporter subunit G [Cecembia sp.]